MPLKNIIFDLDGTLINSYMLGYTATNEVLQANRKETITEETYHACTIYDTPKRFAVHLHGLDYDDKQYEDGVELGRQFDELYIERISTATAGFYPQVLERLYGIIDKYPGLQYAALTNACQLYGQRALAANLEEGGREGGRAGLFTVVHGSDSVPASKPAPDGLIQIMRELGGVRASECVYVGDSPTDGQAGVAAGIRTVGCSYGSYPEKALVESEAFTEGVWGSVEEVFGVIERLIEGVGR
jgi:phosphoglycolate phosphatase